MLTLKITLFSDGRPGHEKQSRGIIEALRHYVDIEVFEVTVERLRPAAQIGAHLRYLVHFDSPSIDMVNTDLVIGTGSPTHIPILSAAREYNAKSVICMTPIGYLIRHFDLCCVPMHDNIKNAGNVFRTIGPPNIAVSSMTHDVNRGLILIGGVDEGSHEWHNNLLIDDVDTLLSEDRLWTISTSPRTPADTEERVNDLVKNRDDVHFLPFSATSPGWIEEQYQINRTVWITADSVSMVYEALSAGCSVGILPVKWKKSDNKFKRSLDYLADLNMIIPFEAFKPGYTQLINPDPLNEADRCAKEILQRWWPTSLP